MEDRIDDDVIGVCLLPYIIVALAMTPAIRAEQMYP